MSREIRPGDLVRLVKSRLCEMLIYTAGQRGGILVASCLITGPMLKIFIGALCEEPHTLAFTSCSFQTIPKESREESGMNPLVEGSQS